MDDLALMETLRLELNQAGYEYYVLDAPTMSDYDYDHKLRQLEKLEAKYPDSVSADSPTQRVGGAPLDSFAQVQHPVPLESLQDVFDFAGGFKAEPRKVIYGGPMMGIAVPDLTAPILKTTNAIVAFDQQSAEAPKETACIRCGRCVNACPFSLMPAAIEGAQKRGDGEKLEALKVNLCMECGCCSFVCPAKRNLVQTNKLGKMELRKYQEAKKAENN